jgi:hypothetical protein
MFNQDLTPIGPRPNLIPFDPLHCYKKIHSRCWRSPLAKKKYTAGLHIVSFRRASEKSMAARIIKERKPIMKICSDSIVKSSSF